MTGEAEIRGTIDRHELQLWALGMHSITFVSDDPGDCAAVVLSHCSDHAAAATIADTLLGEALVRVDTMRFDEARGTPAWLAAPVSGPRLPHPPRRRREQEQALAA
ncbi:MAG: hypothetical protein HY873_07830 [Chloroflexi bacterium]|nr:hypothetical protein [Chloroflexota bacterium]